MLESFGLILVRFLAVHLCGCISKVWEHKKLGRAVELEATVPYHHCNFWQTFLTIKFSINKRWTGKWRISLIRNSLIFVSSFVCVKNTHVVCWLLVAGFILALSHCSWGWSLKRVAWNSITVMGPAASYALLRGPLYQVQCGAQINALFAVL
jgi:uncharacterized protein involved in cysteine biosynthesis